MAVDASGRPLLLVRRVDGESRGYLEIVRLTKSGQIDRSFGPRSNGVAQLWVKAPLGNNVVVVPLRTGGIFIVAARTTAAGRTTLIALDRSGRPNRRFAEDGRTAVRLFDPVAAEAVNGDFLVAGTEELVRGQGIQMFRITPWGSDRFEWGSIGQYKIREIPTAALPPAVAGFDPANVISKLTAFKATYIEARQNGAIDVGVESYDPSVDGDHSKYEWLRRISPNGLTDTAFGANGSIFTESIGYPDNADESEPPTFDLLPDGNDGTLSTAFIGSSRPTLGIVSVDSSGQRNTLQIGDVRFHEHFLPTSIVDPSANSITACGSVISTGTPRRINSYMFKLKLPRR